MPLKLVVTKPVRLKLDKISCRDFYDTELLSKTYTSKSQMSTKFGFIFLRSYFKTRWVVEGGLYSVHRQKQLLLPLCNGNFMLSRPINVTLY